MLENGTVFGTRADFLVDLVLLSFWMLPFLLFLSFRMARKEAYAAHKNIQLAALVLVSSMVVLLEIDIRFFSLTKGIKESIFYDGTVFNLLLGVHILVAVVSLLGWVFLAVWTGSAF